MDKNQEKPKWSTGKKLGVGCGGLIVVIIIISIIISAATNKGGNTTVVTKPTNGTSSSSTKSKAPAATAHVGQTLNIGGSKGLAVDLQQIIDPAKGADEFTTPDAGKRFVAVKLQITNNGSGAYSDDANSNVTLIGSDNQSYTADFDDVSGCTNFSGGQYTLTPGSNATGCVVFQVPDSVNSAKVQFETNSGLLGDTGEWLVP